MRLLLVEDNPADARLIQEMLKDASGDTFHLRHANRLIHALDAIREEMPEAVVLDLGLPDASGLEALHNIQHAFPSIPVVALTGLSDDQTAVDAMRSGAQDYLVKGQINGELLTRTLRYAVERKRIETALRNREADLRLLETCVSRLNDIVLITEAEPINKPGPRILYVNEAFVRRTGYSREEAIGQSPRILQGPNTQRAELDRIRAALAAWQPVRSELVNYTKAGEEFWLELDIVPVGDETGWFTHWVAIERDITTRKRAEAASAEADRKQRFAASVFTHTREGISISEPDGTIIDVNEAFTRITGYARDEVIGQNTGILRSERQDPQLVAAMQSALKTGDYWFGEVWSRRKDGETYAELITINAVRDGSGKLQNHVSIIADLTPFKEHQTQLQRIAHYDAVTSLPNRALLRERVAQDIAMAQRSEAPLAMMMLNIDQFKTVNAAFGHAAGDELLLELGHRLKSAVRDQDTVARVPGEGFVLLLPDTNGDGAAKLAAKLMELVARPFRVGNQEVIVTPSIGIAMYRTDGQDFDTLSASIAAAMHRAQQLGRNNYQFFNADQQTRGHERLTLANALRSALELDELQLHYQPLVDLQTGRVGGMEALLRWRHAELGDISPARFIPVAEESGLIVSMGRWVLRRACRDIRAWLDQGLTVPHVAVNVSPVEFRGGKLAEQVATALREFNVAPELIYLEVTEGSLMTDVGKSEAMLRSLKALGVKLSLDDFGTGYSSLSYLKLFPFDKVKIDQSFIRNIPHANEDAVIAKVVVSMAHGLGLRVIAEGVENEAQCLYLRDNMCDEIQGFLFSHAVPADAILALLEADTRLPAHLMRLQTRSRTMLLVDDEPNVIASLKRLFRRDGYTMLTANSGAQGLEVLAHNPIDLIVSDQRMPGMTGVEFLRTANHLYPDTMRIVLSGYTELESVTNAINEGSVYRFLTKPWDDEQLRRFIAEAFTHKELADENRKLGLQIRTANQELAASNRQLRDVVSDKQAQIAQTEDSLTSVRNVIGNLPVPIIGLDASDTVVFVNIAAAELFGLERPVIGVSCQYSLPELSGSMAILAEGASAEINVAGRAWLAQWRSMDAFSSRSKKLVTLTPRH